MTVDLLPQLPSLPPPHHHHSSTPQHHRHSSRCWSAALALRSHRPAAPRLPNRKVRLIRRELYESCAHDDHDGHGGGEGGGGGGGDVNAAGPPVRREQEAGGSSRGLQEALVTLKWCSSVLWK